MEEYLEDYLRNMRMYLLGTQYVQAIETIELGKIYIYIYNRDPEPDRGIKVLFTRSSVDVSDKHRG